MQEAGSSHRRGSATVAGCRHRARQARLSPPPCLGGSALGGGPTFRAAAELVAVGAGADEVVQAVASAPSDADHVIGGHALARAPGRRSRHHGSRRRTILRLPRYSLER